MSTKITKLGPQVRLLKATWSQLPTVQLPNYDFGFDEEEDDVSQNAKQNPPSGNITIPTGAPAGGYTNVSSGAPTIGGYSSSPGGWSVSPAGIITGGSGNGPSGHHAAALMNHMLQLNPSGKLSVTVLPGINVKTNVKYIVEQLGGQCMELDPADTITPREMINISQFIAVASAVLGGAMADMNWTELAENLDIERHFIFGLPSIDDYDEDDECLYIFLHDA